MFLLALVTVFAGATQMESTNLLGPARELGPRSLFPVDGGSHLVAIGVLTDATKISRNTPVEIIAVLMFML